MSNRPNSLNELERLFQLEYGNPKEIFIRFAGVLIGGSLLVAYSGWWIAYFWPPLFLLAHSFYYTFLKLKKDRATKKDEQTAGALFLVTLCSFLWMPAAMICQEDRALSISGAALIGCILVFLIRRSDTSAILIYGEFCVVAVTIAAVLFTIAPQFDDIWARLGVLISCLALLFYFFEAGRVSRKLRIETVAANLRSLQAEKMAAIGQLAGGVAHDFNNNLTAIMGNLELLGLIDDPIERNALLEEALQASRKAARTVKQLVSFARIEKMTLSAQDGHEVFVDLVSLTEKLVPASIDVKVLESSQALTFLADRPKLLSALVHLVVNAIDAMPAGGVITLSNIAVSLRHATPLADGSSLAPGPYIRVSVADTGSGIPDALLSKVIEPFFTTKPVGKGAGLGLPMALGISKDFGGGLTIETSPSGTTVSLLLPRA